MKKHDGVSADPLRCEFRNFSEGVAEPLPLLHPTCTLPLNPPVVQKSWSSVSSMTKQAQSEGEVSDARASPIGRFFNRNHPNMVENLWLTSDVNARSNDVIGGNHLFSVSASHQSTNVSNPRSQYRQIPFVSPLYTSKQLATMHLE